MYKVNDDLIFNESKKYINSLSYGSSKLVKKICPLCREEKETKLFNVIKSGHSYCKSCVRIKDTMEEMTGKIYGNLTVLSVYRRNSGNDNRGYSTCKCLCMCGKKVDVAANNLKNGHTVSCGCKQHVVGEENPTYNKAISKEERKSSKYQRNSAEANKWKKDVKQHFGNHCFLCGSEQKIEVHHVENFKDNEKLRFDVQNGVCLCRKHHLQYHFDFLGGAKIPATKQSFKSFMEWWLCQLQNC